MIAASLALGLKPSYAVYGHVSGHVYAVDVSTSPLKLIKRPLLEVFNHPISILHHGPEEIRDCLEARREWDGNGMGMEWEWHENGML